MFELTDNNNSLKRADLSPASTLKTYSPHGAFMNFL
jgi:hypothetical protein